MKIKDVRKAMHSAERILVCAEVTDEDWIYLTTTVDELESALQCLETEGVTDIEAYVGKLNNVLHIGG